MTITRQRYFVKLKKNPRKPSQMRETAMHAVLPRCDPPFLMPRNRESWLYEWKPALAILGFASLVGIGVYYLDLGSTLHGSNAPSSRSGIPASAGRTFRAAPSDESFIAAFGSHRGKVQSNNAAPVQKLPGNYSGSCDVGSKGGKDVVQAVTDCLKLHGVTEK